MVSKYVIAAVVGASVIAAVWFHGNYYGKQSVEAEYQKAIIEASQRNSALADKVDQLTVKTKQKTREKVRTIYVTQDDTGCTDSTIPSGVRESLYRESDRPEAN